MHALSQVHPRILLSAAVAAHGLLGDADVMELDEATEAGGETPVADGPLADALAAVRQCGIPFGGAGSLAAVATRQNALEATAPRSLFDA